MSTQEELIYLEALVAKQKRQLEEQESKLAEVEKERNMIIDGVKKALSVIGLYPVPDDGKVKRKALNALSSLVADFTIRPKVVEQKFSFIAELLPIIDKYK